jgi:hypothetical protein
MAEHATEKPRTTGFAHGKVDPRIAGAEGGKAPRLPVNPRNLMCRIADGGNGAAHYALARDLGLLER